MIGIHKFCATKDTNADNYPLLTYFQIKDGFAFASNSFTAISIPLAEVFGEGIFKDTEEYYISGEKWQREKFHKARRICRENDTLKAYSSKGIQLGEITLLKLSQITDGVYPNYKSCLPDADNYSPRFSFNTKLLSSISECFSNNLLELRPDNDKREFFTVRVMGSETKAQILLAGLFIEGYKPPKPDEVADLERQLEEAKRMVAAPAPDYTTNSEIDESRIRDLEEELKEANAKIEEQTEQLWRMENLETDNSVLEDEVNDLKERLEGERDKVSDVENERDTAQKELEKFKEYEGRYYKAETVQEEIIYEAFIEALNEVKPMVLLDTLRNLKELG